MSVIKDADFIWGAWRARHSEASASPVGFARRLALCLDLGVNWIDHADIYDQGAVEALHGEALTHLDGPQRQRLRLITKCGIRFPSANQPDVRAYHYRSDAAWIRQQVEASLTRLGVGQIDLYLLHRPDYLMQVEETARALEDLQADGKISAFGASNFSPAQFERLDAAASGALAAHQVELSPLASEGLDNGIVDQALARDIPMLIWSPLAGGRLFDTGEATDRLRAALCAAADRAGGDDVAATALAWLKRLPGRIIPILGTMNEARLRTQVEQARRMTIDTQDWYAILEAGRGERAP